MIQNYKTTSFDRTIKSLCSQVDRLEEEVDYWKNCYEEQLKATDLLMKESLLNAQKGVAEALRFALASTDDENGNF